MKGARIAVKNQDEIKNRVRQEKNPNVKIKLAFLNLVSDSRSDLERICELCGVAVSTGYQWVREWNEKGYESVKEKRNRGGRPPKLSDEDLKQLRACLEKKEMWGLKEVRGVIKERFGADLSEDQVARILKQKLYFSAQAMRREHEGLETRLEERNAELAGANEALQAEIRERELAEEALRESELRYLFLAKNLPRGIMHIMDKDMRYVFNEGEELKNIGLSNEPLVGKSIFEVLPRDTAEMMEANYQRVFDGEPVTFEGEFAGNTYLINAVPMNYKDGAVNQILVLSVNITERKRIEEMLRESEEKYRGLFDNAGDAVITLDLDDRITSWNKSAERIFGWKSEEVVGKKLTEFTIPEDRYAERDQIIRDALLGKNISGIETVRMRRDGGRIHVSLTFSPIINAERKITGLSGIVRDITERKSADEERLRLIEEIKKKHIQTENLAMNLRKERDTLQIIMENTGAHLAYLDSNFNFIRVNSAYAKGSGHNKEELIGRNHFELFPDPDNRAIFEKARGSGEAVEFKAKPFEFADQPWRGVTYWDWTLTPLKDESGKVDRLVLSLMDVTERIRAEKTMESALDYAESIVDTVPVPLVILDRELKVKTANHAFYRTFKVPIEETRDNLLYDIGNRKWDIPKLRELLEKIIPDNAEINEFEVTQELPNIGQRTFLLNARKFHQEKTEMILLSLDDVTERKRIEDMKLENERLIYANRTKTEFLNIMSHELRTPLTSVIGYSILLKEKAHGKLNQKQEFYMESILANSKHLLDLINSTLDLAKIEAGKMELVIENVSVPQVIDEGLSLIKEKASMQKVLLKKKLDPVLGSIEADGQKFKQILFNLLSNALKFSKEGGVVTVSAGKEGDMAKISVSDTGIGMREEDMPKLFQKFVQLDSGISRKYGGTGLGLAITKQLVEMHGGKITVESSYGKGSTFTILLPISAKRL